MFKLALIPLTMFALIACTKDSESDTAGPGETDETDVTTDPTIDLEWTADNVTVTLTNIDTTGFDFGMAETLDMEGGWFGEDCLNGTGSYQLCHVFDGTSGTLDSLYKEITVDETATVDDIVAGESTLFDNTFDARITYQVTVDGGDCWVWGHNPAYYTAATEFASCEVLTGM